MDAAVWAAVGILAAVQFGGFFYLRSQIDALAARMDARFDRVDARFDRMDERFDRLDERLTRHIEHHPS